ncbi:hypothetical protein O6H91_11G062900 [Diphasiastrum complanatum]|uniref:Uncharacterized protein n=1 Tax=Diphasiastrum complanatum TaxID=34168 RepID=A0ACC2C9U5_DIPCM|nr:hypothetical protein O6H91_11G062900 [Diphasiastrum complanatum]
MPCVIAKCICSKSNTVCCLLLSVITVFALGSINFSDSISSKQGSKLLETPSTSTIDLVLPLQGISSNTDPEIIDGSPDFLNRQLNTVIDTLRRAGPYSVMAEALNALGLQVLPPGSTLFVPTDGALSVIQRSSVLVPLVQYHVALVQLRFPQLLESKVGTRIPTLLPDNTIVITNNTMVGYTIDNVYLAYPDLYNDAVISIHGIEGIFNATLYGHVDSPAANSTDTSSITTVSSSPASAPFSGAPIVSPDATTPQASTNSPEVDQPQEERPLPPIGLLTPPDLPDIFMAAGSHTTKHQLLTLIISSSLILNMYLLRMLK